MFKDYHKYLSASLKVYLFVLVLVFILKLVGLDYFNLTTEGNLFNKIDTLLPNNALCIAYTYLLLYYTTFIITSISCKDNSNKMKLYILLTYPLSLAVNYIPKIIDSTIIFWIISLLYLLVLCLVYSKFKNVKAIAKRYLIFTILNLIYQIVSVVTRGVSISNNSFLIMFILNLDYILLLFITYKLCFIKGGRELCYQQAEAGSSLQKKLSLKMLLRKLQANLHNFKQKPKEDRLAISIYIVLSLLWNTLSLAIILLVANLNHTFIECIFILTSFWLTKTTFGKAFHLPNMAQCFIVSNLTYYCLNKITTPLGISILIPILLGVGLSYFTSKLVKKLYKPLYRGMPKDLFEEIILKVVDKDSDKYKICYEYFVEKKSAVSLSMKYAYSEAGIRKIKDRVNEQIKKLN